MSTWTEMECELCLFGHGYKPVGKLWVIGALGGDRTYSHACAFMTMVAWSYWDRNSCYIGISMACPSWQQLQQRVGRGNGVRSYQASDRQVSASETQRDRRPKSAFASRDNPDRILLLLFPLIPSSNNVGKSKVITCRIQTYQIGGEYLHFSEFLLDL